MNNSFKTNASIQCVNSLKADVSTQYGYSFKADASTNFKADASTQCGNGFRADASTQCEGGNPEIAIQPVFEMKSTTIQVDRPDIIHKVVQTNELEEEKFSQLLYRLPIIFTSISLF